MSITEFLVARIAEDEAAARACDVAAWTINRDERPAWVTGLGIAAMDSTWDACIAVTDAEHVVRHDPARVLAECASKRVVIEHHGPGDNWHRDYCETCAEWWDSEVGEGPPPVRFPCPTLRAVAAVYADHPDYQQEWAA
jgi:hypothetical protein